MVFLDELGMGVLMRSLIEGEGGGAEVIHEALLAFGSSRYTDVSSMRYQQVGQFKPLLLGKKAHQIPLYLIPILLLCEAQPF